MAQLSFRVSGCLFGNVFGPLQFVVGDGGDGGDDDDGDDGDDSDDSDGDHGDHDYVFVCNKTMFVVIAQKLIASF